MPALSTEPSPPATGRGRHGRHPEPRGPRRRPRSGRPGGLPGHARRRGRGRCRGRGPGPQQPDRPGGLFAAVAQAAAGADLPVLLVASDASAHALPRVSPSTAPRRRRALARTMRYAAWRRVPADEPPEGLGLRASFARAGPPSGSRPGRPGRVAAGRRRSELLAPYGIEHVGVPARDTEDALRGGRDPRLPGGGEGGRPDRPAQDRPGVGQGRLRSAAEVAAAIEAFRGELGAVGRRARPAGADRRRGGVRVVRDEVFDPWSGSPRAASRPRSGATRSICCLRSPSDAARAPRAADLAAARRVPRRRTGRRGRLEAVVVAVGQLTVDVPEVSDLDLNPLLVTPRACTAST